MDLPVSTITKEQKAALIREKIHKMEHNSKDNINIQNKLKRELKKLEA